MRRFSFHKGHATQNDFIILDDSYAMHEVHPEFIKVLCDRRAGIGADGVIRVVRASSIREWDGDPTIWFMDYYNSDGSVAEMCGNGLRVFARYLINEQLVDTGSFDVATRAGVKHVELGRIGEIRAQVGAARIIDDEVHISHQGQSWPATKVDVGNPHAVVFLEGGLDDLDLHTGPTWQPADVFPEGVNVEFIEILAPGKLRMRVHERGSGETRSCGTGVVAAARAYRERTGYDGDVEVTVPGGDLSVEFDGEDATLTGPAVIIARGEYWL